MLGPEEAKKIGKKQKEYMGNQIRIHRKNRGWSQDEFALQLDVDKQTVYRMEQGKFSAESILAAMLVLDLTLEELLPKECFPEGRRRSISYRLRLFNESLKRYDMEEQEDILEAGEHTMKILDRCRRQH